MLVEVKTKLSCMEDFSADCFGRGSYYERGKRSIHGRPWSVLKVEMVGFGIGKTL